LIGGTEATGHEAETKFQKKTQKHQTHGVNPYFVTVFSAPGQISNELRFFLSHFLLRLTSQALRREAELLRPETKNQLERISPTALFEMS
jgi:hypothetical protein